MPVGKVGGTWFGEPSVVNTVSSNSGQVPSYSELQNYHRASSYFVNTHWPAPGAALSHYWSSRELKVQFFLSNYKMRLIVERKPRHNLAHINWNQQNTFCLWDTVWIQSEDRDDFRGFSLFPDWQLFNIFTFHHEERIVTMIARNSLCRTEFNNTAL